jgi:hypothetical protein
LLAPLPISDAGGADEQLRASGMDTRDAMMHATERRRQLTVLCNWQLKDR